MRLTLLLLCCLVQSVTWAGDLPKPVGKPILTIYGNIENTNENGKAVFDLASLEKLGVVSFETTSPWYNGRTKFEGVPMSKLMDYVVQKVLTLMLLRSMITLPSSLSATLKIQRHTCLKGQWRIYAHPR
jgi:hypothetical protein